MTAMTRGIDAYRRTEAQSATPMQLVVMLYDGALRFLTEAKGAQAVGDLPRRSHALRKVATAIDEVHKLMTTLRNAWAEVAAQGAAAAAAAGTSPAVAVRT